MEAKRPRFAKVIAATATISDPDRHFGFCISARRAFSVPGAGIYESFFAMPREPLNGAAALSGQAPARLRPEQLAPRMRATSRS